VCFHGIFDFAYLLKALTGEPFLPHDEAGLKEQLRLYFPSFYDLKVLTTPYEGLQGSLSKLCDCLDVKTR
jgi:CCR4-NOT transcription complex subunit 7/8